MVDIREIGAGQTRQAVAPMLELRPRWQTGEALAAFIDTALRPAGYRLAGVFEDGGADAVSAVGFREAHSTAWGHHVYVDDLSTVATARSRGYGDALIQWVITEAGRLGCEAVHLDSGVGEDRAAAHRLYLRNHLSITAHHFACPVHPAAGHR